MKGFILFLMLTVAGIAAVFILYPEQDTAPMLTLGYIAASFAMGFGIAIDVMCATIGRFRAFTTWQDGFTWALRNSVTHTLFPVAGIVISLALVAFWGPFKLAVGVGAFVLVAMLLVGEARDRAGLGDEDEDDDEAELPWWLGFLKPVLTKEWALVFAVSVDALMSGPAKAAQTEGWSMLMTAVSFPVVGLVVGGFALIAVLIARGLRKWLREASGEAAKGLAKFQIIGLFVESVVIGYFGVMALMEYTFGMNWAWYDYAAIAAALTSIGFFILRKRMWETQLEEAIEAIG